MAVREGRWDCQYCGAVGIRGRHKACGNCGRSRPAGTKFYLPPDSVAVEEEALLNAAKVGPDWVCAFCDSSNPATLSICYSCRAPRDADARDQAVQTFDLDAVPTSGDNAAPETVEPSPVGHPIPATVDLDTSEPVGNPVRRLLVPLAFIGFFVLSICVCAALISSQMQPDDVTLTVVDRSWERTAEIEALTTIVEEGWDLPSDAFLLESSEEIREYEQVIIGYETVTEEVAEQVQVGERTYVCAQRDLGNGFFEDVECTEPIYETQYRTESYEEPVYAEEPIYDTFYVYEVDRWTTVSTFELSGEDDDSAFWPELADGERFSTQQETFFVTFADEDGNQYRERVGATDWRQFNLGESFVGSISPQGQLLDVNE